MMKYKNNQKLLTNIIMDRIETSITEAWNASVDTTALMPP